MLPRISLNTRNWTVSHYTDPGSRSNFDLDAPYQRGSVWDVDQKRNLIKSLLMGLPIGSLLIAERSIPGAEQLYRVIDGKQRIEAVCGFVDGEFSIPGGWVDMDGEVIYPDLPGSVRRMIDNASMPALHFEPDIEWIGRDAAGKSRWRARTAVEIISVEAEMFLLVNFGGVPQTGVDRDRAAAVAATKA